VFNLGGECQADQLELELRFGPLSPGDARSIKLGMETGLWYALFQHMAGLPDVRIVASQSRVEHVSGQGGLRVLHTADHRQCRRECKSAALTHTDVPLVVGTASAVRVSVSRKMVLDANACGDGAVETPCFMLRRRERRSIYVLGPDAKPSYWRFDFTRVNGKESYELKAELELARALTRTQGCETTQRTDAILTQLESMIQCLLDSIERAHRVHSDNMQRLADARSGSTRRTRPTTATAVATRTAATATTETQGDSTANTITCAPDHKQQ
jgi:hypothetical protein